jgi:hypothetical protein
LQNELLQIGNHMGHRHHIGFIFHIGELPEELISAQYDLPSKLHKFIKEIDLHPDGLILTALIIGSGNLFGLRFFGWGRPL